MLATWACERDRLQGAHRSHSAEQGCAQRQHDGGGGGTGHTLLSLLRLVTMNLDKEIC